MKILSYFYWGNYKDTKYFELNLDPEAYEICINALKKAAHDEYMTQGVDAKNWSMNFDMNRVVESMSMMKKCNEVLEDLEELKKEGMLESTPRKELKLEDIITQVENLSRKYGNK